MKNTMVDVNSIVENALDKLYEVRKAKRIKQRPTIEDVSWYSWPQLWGNATCGFGGVGASIITRAQTVAIEDEETNAIAVYHAGRYAYTVKSPSKKFWELVSDFNLPGVNGHRVGIDEIDQEDKLAVQ